MPVIPDGKAILKNFSVFLVFSLPSKNCPPKQFLGKVKFHYLKLCTLKGFKHIEHFQSDIFASLIIDN
jgi:hypothetical protein